MKDMDQQLASREEECLSYKKLLDDLRANFSLNNNDAQREMLRMLKVRSLLYFGVGKYLGGGEKPRKRTEDPDPEGGQSGEGVPAAETDTEPGERGGKTVLERVPGQAQVRNNKGNKYALSLFRRLLDVAESTARVDAELRYAERQHNRLASTNVLDLAFHIWVTEGGTIRK